MLMTSNPDYIRRWTAQRGGHPARPPGQGWPRIDFTGSEQAKDAITWEEFFQLLDRYHLALAYDPAPTSRQYTLMATAEESEEEPETKSARKPGEENGQNGPGEENDEPY